MDISLSLFCDHCGAANASQATVCFVCHQPLHAPPPAQAPHTPVHAQVSAGQAALVFPSSAAPSVPASRLHQRYHLISEIGQGGFGLVYKAQDSQNNNKLVAIKQINLHSLGPREIIDATDTYNREVSLLSTLKHANLPRIYDHFTDPEHWYLVMDFIAGETLENYLHKAKKRYLRVREVLTIGIQLCTVLDYLHTQKHPIIFRDVKPANIMRTPKGQLYLIDFGIARHFTPGQTKDTGPLGSPGYAAPEQYGKAQTTVQTDIYGLGATLQTLLTGADPLEAAGGGTSSIPTRCIPKKLHQLLNQMCEPDASKRPQSMDEVKRHLQQIKGGKARSILPTILAANGLLLYLLTIIADVVSIAIRYWIGSTLSQIVVSATAPASAQTFPSYVVGLIFAFAPVAWGIIALIGLPSGSTLTRFELQGRTPNTQEWEIVERALAELLSIHPGIRRPRTWLVSSTIEPDTLAIGTTLYISSDLLKSDRQHLTASLAHALGHLNTLDSRLIEALKRLKIRVVYFLVYALDSLGLGAFRRQAGLTWNFAGREAGCFITMLEIVLTLIAGGLGLRIISPLWRMYFHTREYAADGYASYLGQGQVLTRIVDNLNPALDVPFEWMWDRAGTSRYVQKRLALLRQQPPISTGLSS